MLLKWVPVSVLIWIKAPKKMTKWECKWVLVLHRVREAVCGPAGRAGLLRLNTRWCVCAVQTCAALSTLWDIKELEQESVTLQRLVWLHMSVEILRDPHRFNCFTVEPVSCYVCAAFHCVSIKHKDRHQVEHTTPPPRSLSHFSSSNYLSYWFHSAPGGQTPGHVL